MQSRHSGEVVAPFVQIIVLVRNGFDLVIGHNRVRCTLQPVFVEFFLKQFVDSLVYVERRAAGTPDLQPGVQPETARTLHEQLDLAATYLERFGLARLIWFSAGPGVITRHIVAIVAVFYLIYLKREYLRPGLSVASAVVPKASPGVLPER